MATYGLPNAVAGANFRSAFLVDPRGARFCRVSEEMGPPPVVAQVALAEELRRRLDGGEALSQGEVARSFRLTPARVAQLLGLLRLAPSLLEYVRGLPPGTPARMVTERSLRPLTQLTEEEQIRRAMRNVPGFAVFMERKRMAA